MPIYVYRCTACGTTQEELRNYDLDSDKTICGFCGEVSERAHDKERVSVRSDIEPGYNISLGTHIGSRRELREKLAFNNANSPELMLGSNPSEGRMVKEERVEYIDKQRLAAVGRGEALQKVEAPDDLVGQYEIEGKADYGIIKQTIKDRHERRRQ